MQGNSTFHFDSVCPMQDSQFIDKSPPEVEWMFSNAVSLSTKTRLKTLVIRHLLAYKLCLCFKTSPRSKSLAYENKHIVIWIRASPAERLVLTERQKETQKWPITGLFVTCEPKCLFDFSLYRSRRFWTNCWQEDLIICNIINIYRLI